MRGILAFIVPRRGGSQTNCAGKSRPPACWAAGRNCSGGNPAAGRPHEASTKGKKCRPAGYYCFAAANGSAILDHNRERLDRR